MSTKVKGEAIKEGSIPFSALDETIQEKINSIPKPSPYEMVDLGLSVKWANMNVGATSPEEAGLYFQWGDTNGYTAEQVGTDKVFDWTSYFDNPSGDGQTFTKYNIDGGLTTLEAADDAATVHMGGSWRMPTSTEIEELINNTTQTFIDMDGNVIDHNSMSLDEMEAFCGKLKGVRFTASNSNSIFIPCLPYAGAIGELVSLWGSNLNDEYSSMAYTITFDYTAGIDCIDYDRNEGFSVRGVCEETDTVLKTTPQTLSDSAKNQVKENLGLPTVPTINESDLDNITWSEDINSQTLSNIGITQEVIKGILDGNITRIKVNKDGKSKLLVVYLIDEYTYNNYYIKMLYYDTIEYGTEVGSFVNVMYGYTLEYANGLYQFYKTE